MNIGDVKKELRHREWAEQIRECQGSGMKVRDWCESKGIKPYTYYRRLRVIRDELLKNAVLPVQQIVPVSISAELSEQPPIGQTTIHAESNTDRIIIRANGIEAELPQSITPEALSALLRGIRQC